MMNRPWYALILLLLAAIPVQGQVQPPVRDDVSHWGVAGTFVPQWEFLDFLEGSMDRSIELTGADYRIGIIRGRQQGGDWGASFVKRRIDDDSIVLEETTNCLALAGRPDVCARGTMHQPQSATLTGLEFHRYFALGTVARRVQIGATLTGGFAKVQGHALETIEHLQVTIDPATGATRVGTASETATIEAREIFDHLPISEFMPTGGVEGVVAVLVAPGVKLKVSAGANFPGFHVFAITAQYLFGTR